MNEILYRYNPWWEKDFTELESLKDRSDILPSLIKQFEDKQITFLTGIRRVGKSSLMKLCIRHLILNLAIEPTHILYVSLDDFLLKDESILSIIEAFRKAHKLSHSTTIYLFLDEVTFAKDYEIQLKNLFDQSKTQIFAASSNAGFVRKQTGLLTGRNTPFEILPLDFDQYLHFKNIQISKADTQLREAHFKTYLENGGLPGYVLTDNDNLIKQLVDDIIYKDIAALNGIRQLNQLKDYFLMLMERSGKTMSINKVSKVLGISTETSKRYFDLFCETFLIYPVSRYGKLNEQMVSPKKIYCCDTRLRVYFTGARDYGALFENYVFLRLKHLGLRYIYENTTEIDFFTENKWLIECKFHDEALSKKQQELFDSYPAKEKRIVRNEGDVLNILGHRGS